MGRFGGKGDNERDLRAGEIALIKKVFQTAKLPDLSDIHIADGLSASGTPWTDSDYQINVGESKFNQDLTAYYSSTLVHEMTHVWQYHNGLLTKGHALTAHVRAGATDWVQKKLDRVLPGHWDDDEALDRLYSYDLDGSFLAMGFEGQAQMVEDWYDMGMKTEGYRYVFVKYVIWNRDLAAAKLTRAELMMRHPEIPADQDIYIDGKTVAQEQRQPLTDAYLIDLLQTRYAANDVKGFGARVRQVERAFRSTSIAEALPLLTRLKLQNPADKVAKYFHDHLSTAARDKLLQILQKRSMGK